MTDAPSPKPANRKPAAPAGKKPAARKPSAAARPAAKPRPRRALIRPGLLPATIFAAMLMVGFKVGDIWLTVTTGKGLSLVSTSVAEEPAPQGLPAKPDGQARSAAPAVSAPARPSSAVPLQVASNEPPAPVAAPAAPVTTEGHDSHEGQGAAPSGTPGQSFSPTELELLQRLQERREQLDTRSRELDQREAMLAAAEQRFDQKIAELQGLKKEIQGLLTQVNAEQQAQLDSLVKIYETMKPADAAKIFNSLENAVLINVISRMKEAKVAPVLAAMEEKRAQEVTILLAERKRLPTVPD